MAVAVDGDCFTQVLAPEHSKKRGDGSIPIDAFNPFVFVYIYPSWL